MTVSRLLDTLAAAVIAPGVFLHEFAHAATARLLGAEKVALTDIGCRPAVSMTWSPDVPPWRIRVAHLAPTLLSPLAVAGAVALLSLQVTTMLDVAAGVMILGNTIVFVWPSQEDRHPEVTA